MFQQKKAYSAVTVAIENLTSESYQEDDFSGIPELVDVIKLQASGPTEAARAIRKKLKYGNAHRQIRALVILDGLILNAGQQFQRTFADEPLLERLRVCGTSDLSDPEVKKKCRELFRGWASYGSVKGLERISVLHKELPKRKVGVTQERSKAVQETDANPFGDEEEEEAARVSRQAADGNSAGSSFSNRKEPPAADAFTNQKTSSSSFFGSSSKDKKKDKSRGKKKPFSLEQEKEQIKTVIAESSLATTNLLNALQSINREKERISDNQMAVQRFEACKQLRRRVLRYVHHVEEEQWLGGLLHANDELVHALMSFEQMDHSIDADSDSDDEIAEQAHLYRMIAGKAHQESTSPTSPHAPPDVSSLRLGSPPKPAAPPRPPVPQAAPPPRLQTRESRESWESASDEQEDEDDPFADKNVVETPAVEKGEPRWGR